jgi:predicted amidohydrolase
MTNPSIKIAAAQSASTACDKTANLETLRLLCESASGNGANLIVFPELFLTGYSAGERFRDLAEASDGPAFEAVSKVAQSCRIAICYGYPERDGEKVFNAAQLVGPDGNSLGNHRKTHLYGTYERQWFDAGQSFVDPIMFNGITINILICYEIEFPEVARVMARQGNSILLVPTATGFENNPNMLAQTLVRARAAENHFFVAYANHAAGETGLDLNGHSVIAGPFGKIAAESHGDDQEVICCDFSIEEVFESRRVNPYMRDLREDILSNQNARDI